MAAALMASIRKVIIGGQILRILRNLIYGKTDRVILIILVIIDWGTARYRGIEKMHT